jgi:hypothetical protein
MMISQYGYAARRTYECDLSDRDAKKWRRHPAEEREHDVDE